MLDHAMGQEIGH